MEQKTVGRLNSYWETKGWSSGMFLKDASDVRGKTIQDAGD